MEGIELLPLIILGIFSLISLNEIEKTNKLMLQRLQWIHEDMKRE